MLLVVGDSHSFIWGGLLLEEKVDKSQFPQVKICHISDALAYNLMGKDGEIGKWGNQVFSHINDHKADLSAIMLSFGEIDIRTQVVRRAISEGLSLTEAVEPIIRRYMQFVDLLRLKTAVPIFLWGPVPSASDFGVWNPHYPNSGSEIDRNLATKIFNIGLEQASRKRKSIYAFYVFDKFVLPGGRTNKKYFADGCHLGKNALEYITQAFNYVVQKHDLDLPDFFATQLSLGQKKVEIKDISSSARIISISSDVENKKPSRIDNPGDKLNYFFHTEKDPVPFIQIDLGYGALLHNIIIYNRFDTHKERARTLEVWIGTDLCALNLAYKHDGQTFGLNGAPLEVMPEKNQVVRYIVLRLAEAEHFHLGKIIVLAKSFL